MSSRLALLALASLAACASAPKAALTPLTVLRHERMRLAVEPEPGGLPPADALAPWSDPDANAGPLVTLTLQLFAVDAELLDQALGDRAGALVAVACSRADARRLLEELERRGEPAVSLLHGPARWAQHSGESGSISVARQSAYVAGFHVDSAPDGSIADPRIDVATEGVLFTADARSDEASGSVAVELMLTVCELEHPFAEPREQLFADAVPVTIQLPAGIARRLSARTELGRDEALLFGGSSLPADERGRALLAFFEADAAPSVPTDVVEPR
jgi:hypothetical protein